MALSVRRSQVSEIRGPVRAGVTVTGTRGVVSYNSKREILLTFLGDGTRKVTKDVKTGHKSKK